MKINYRKDLWWVIPLRFKDVCRTYPENASRTEFSCCISALATLCLIIMQVQTENATALACRGAARRGRSPRGKTGRVRRIASLLAPVRFGHQPRYIAGPLRARVKDRALFPLLPERERKRGRISSWEFYAFVNARVVIATMRLKFASRTSLPPHE